MRAGDKGRRGEDMAVRYMLGRGMSILERNYRREHCEIDVIAMDGGTLVFAEVKARSTDSMGSGREAVTLKKQRNIIKAARYYIWERGEESAARFDVAEVDLATGAVEYIKSAFET